MIRSWVKRMISKQLLVKLLEEEHEKYGDEYDWEQVMKDIEDFPDEQEEGGKKIDRIRLDMALETPIWQVIYAAEPRRKIDVRMTYADLACIYGRMVYDEDGVRYEDGV